MNDSNPPSAPVMDPSTDGVTLNAAFVQDILNMFDGKPNDLAHLKLMTAPCDLSQPDNKVPMHIYNQMCDYVLQEIGPANTRVLGHRIGETAFLGMMQAGLLPDKPTPLQVMEALVLVANVMIQDPKGRGWQILEQQPGRIVMRRTQTFNSVLQLGLLAGLLAKTGVGMARVNYLNQMEHGASFDEYVLTWLV